MQVEFEAVCGPKFMTFWDNVGDLLQLSKHLTDCLYHVSFRRYRPLKLLLSCEVVQKRWFLGSRFVGQGVSQISDMRFQITLTSDHVADFR